MCDLALITNSCTSVEGEQDSIIQTSSITQKTSNEEINNLAKQIVQVSARINLNENLIETNEQKFYNDIQSGLIFNSQYTTFSEMGQTFEDYFGIDKNATTDLFTLIYDNRELISNVDPKGELLKEAIVHEAEIYTAANPQQKVIFGGLVYLINPKQCGWAVAAGILDTAISAVATAVTSPTGAGAVIGAASTATFYATTVAAAVRCKK